MNIKIQSLEANNFKSLVDFKIKLSQFNCLVGLNGSGKSTVLQFIDFVSQLVRGDMEGWLDERKWKPADLKSKLTKKSNIELQIDFADKDGQPIGYWESKYNPTLKRCTFEKIRIYRDRLTVRDGWLQIRPSLNSNEEKIRKEKIAFDYEGSILSQLKEEVLPSSMQEVKKLMEEVKSLDLLSPEYLRQKTRQSSGSLGLGGQKLASFLYELDRDEKNELRKKLKTIYPQFKNLYVKSLRAGWKELQILEEYPGYQSGTKGFLPRMRTDARHINDGMLRLIAILAELQSEHHFLLFDEIENGINPELVEFVINVLTDTEKQVLVTTHSPMMLNYLSDEIAKEGVIYLYKSPEGTTKAVPFFSIPSMAEKLTVMGPGEVFVDTILTELHEEIQQMEVEEK